MTLDDELNVSNRNRGLIIVARSISDFGAFLNMVALSTYVYWLSQSAIAVSVFLACRVFGGIVASLLGVALFQRFTGRVPLVFLDLFRASLLTPLLFLPSAQQLMLLPFIAFGIGLGNSLFAIGLNSQLPIWVAADQRVATNAWLTSVGATGAVLGSLCSGLIMAAGGFQMIFTVNVITYVVAAGLILPLTVLYPSTQQERGTLSDQWRELVRGLRGAPVLAVMLLISLLDTLGSAAHNVGFPLLAEDIDPGESTRVMGYLLAVWALGKFVGARFASRRLQGRASERLERAFLLGVALMSSAFIVTFQQSELHWALAFIVWAGMGDGVAEVALISRAQSEPQSLRLPLFSLLTLSQMVGFGVGMLLVGPFYSSWPLTLVIVLFHGLPLFALLLTAVWLYFRSNTAEQRVRYQGRQ
ncbi:MFS transporter [Pseudomonas sp. GD03858]|uniref:MFS transporter n=1 Tax=unclassified Pseudomonas TaxID=196821 RepID=UPI00244D0C67|nr:MULTISPECIES: MFS transporter [unclassified Pseudomonas]MDH0645342.1 MFS transporter [Pseudomonas sp. GD03867]MDH0660964.1 MFS transporter [Pseudomonas sp. GD03858]